MATELKLRRGTTAQHENFTGANAEVTVDTDKNTIVVHDGSTPGGFPIEGRPLVQQPENIAPADNATGTLLTPELEASDYGSLYSVPMASAQWQISEVSDFSTTVVDDTVSGTSTTYTPSSYLDPNTSYFWRVRYADDNGDQSEFSEATSFQTANIFTDQPTITEPADGATDIAEQPIIESSAFNTVNGSDTHVASQWVITRVSDGVEVFDSGEDTSNLESIQVPAGVLDEGEVSYTVKVRHKGDTYGFSAYSPEITFTTQTEFFDYIEASIGLQTDGGYYAGNVFSDVDGYLKAVIVSDGDGDTDRTGAGSKQWRTSQTALTEAQTLADGNSVMNHIVANETLADFPAFEWIQTTLNDANYNGYSDWYLPARDELELLYRHFKPTTDGNNDATRPSGTEFGADGATHGTNDSSDPTGSGYTLSDPSQTSITSFQDGGADYLTDGDYWSSTEYDASNGWSQYFLNGGQGNGDKGNTARVRAVRNVTVGTFYNPLNIGMEMDGGFYAGNIRSDVDGNWYALIVSDAGGDTVQQNADDKEWRTSNTALSQAQTLSDGKSVMDHIVANETLADFPAFEWVQTTLNDANYEGYNDWYIPARDELELLYRNFKPTTNDNSTSSRSDTGFFGGDGKTNGTNLFTAPADYDGYTTSDPAQTSLVSFQDSGANAFADFVYWSATEYNANESWRQTFVDGFQFDGSDKTQTSAVRAVRRIQISQ